MTCFPGSLQSSWCLSEVERPMKAPKVIYIDIHLTLWHLLGHFFFPNWNWILLWCCLAPFLSKSPGCCLEGGVCVLAILPVPSPAHITPFWEQFPFTNSALLIPWVSKFKTSSQTSREQIWAPPPLFRVNQHIDTFSWITQPSDFVWEIFFFCGCRRGFKIAFISCFLNLPTSIWLKIACNVLQLSDTPVGCYPLNISQAKKEGLLVIKHA